MVDVTPYIIVDNKRIAPIGRSTAQRSATDKPTPSAEQDFGIVDRVTISKAAKEKSRSLYARTGNDSPFKAVPPHEASIPIRPLLTYSPKQTI